MLLFILPAIKGIQHLINNNFENMGTFLLDSKVSATVSWLEFTQAEWLRE